MKSRMHRRSSSCLVLGVFLSLFVAIPLNASDCRGKVMSNPAEKFRKGDEPSPVVVNGSRFSTPYGYKRKKNATRSYPLVVIGRWGEGKGYFNDKIRKKYPAFYIEFQHSNPADGARLAGIIDAAVEQGLRIDVNRILYTGFSAGGSGSFKLIRGMAGKGRYFAAVNRIAGQSESIMEKSAKSRTTLWLHIGLKDAPKRVEVSRKLYKDLKGDPINAGAVEKKTSDTIKKPGTKQKVKRDTWVLIKDGIEIVRYSEYPSCGHDAWIGYADPYLFEWIFERRITEEK